MAVFKVKAGTLEGRILRKEVEASSKEDLFDRLEKEGLFPIDVSPKGIVLPFLKLGRKVSSADLLVFNYGFLTLLKAGLPLLDSLDALKKSSKNQHLSEAITEAIREIKNGQPLSESMRKNSGVFPELYTASIAAGERTGDLVPSIKGYIDFQKKMEAIRKKIVSSAVYPAVLALTSIIVVVFLITYVVPSFAKIYTDTGAELPVATAILLGVTGFLKGHILFLASLAVAAIFGARAAYKSGAGRVYFDAFKLRAPHVGEIYTGYTIAKFSRTLGMVLKSGVPLIQALQMSKGVLNNMVLDQKLKNVIKKTREGEGLTEAIAKEDFMPEITLRMFGVGERSASLPLILEEIADYHEEDVNHKVGILTDLLEPALMVVMGLIIGTIIVLMYLPIFQLGERF